jgi:hypothetical protein
MLATPFRARLSQFCILMLLALAFYGKTDDYRKTVRS